MNARQVTNGNAVIRYVCGRCGLSYSYMERAEDCCSEGVTTNYEKPSAFTKQEGGDHYTKLKVQPLEYSMANGLDAMQHTAIKYITRFRDKAGIDDLRKAIHTIELLIEWESKK